MDQNVPTRGNTLIGTILRAVEGRLTDVHTTIPAKVVRVSSNGQQVDCQILVKEAYLDEDLARQTETLPVIPGCPVEFLRAGGYTLTCPISDGNLVIEGETIPATVGRLVFTQRSMDKWLAGAGQIVDPEIDHKHGLSDGIFVPGLRPFGAAVANFPMDHMTLGSEDGVRIHFRGQTITIGDEDGSDFIALAQKVLNELTAIKTAFNDHTHTYSPGTGSPVASGIPSASYSPNSVAAVQGKTK